MNKIEKVFNELTFYTLSHKSPTFIHQHIVDAQGAQTADEHTKPIRVIFSLVGLYLYLEKDYTGKKIQNFHKLMSQNKISWPEIQLPRYRGHINVSDVLATSQGLERDKMIKAWCLIVWDSYKESRNIIIDLAKQYETEYLNKK